MTATIQQTQETPEPFNAEPDSRQTRGTITPSVQAFCIDTVARAEWLLRKLTDIEAEQRRVQVEVKGQSTLR